ncbi:MAG: hypothetical protein AAGG48_29330 [Planctomycetota bacterium]
MRSIIILVTLGVMSPHVQAGGWLGKALLHGSGRAAGRAAAEAGGEIAKQSAKQVLRRSSQKALQEATEQTSRQVTKAFEKTLSKSLAGGASKQAISELTLATAKLTGRNQRRLLMMAEDLNRTGRTADLVAFLGSAAQPDRIIEALWANRGKLATGAALSALVIHGDDMVEAVASHVAGPAIEQSIESTMKHVAGPIAAKASPIALSFGVVVALAAPILVFSVWTKTRMLRRMAALLTFAFGIRTK